MKYGEATTMMIRHRCKGVWQAEDRLYYEGHENVSLVDMPHLGVEVPAGWCCKMAVVEALQSTVRKNGPCVGEQSRQVKLCYSTLVQCAVGKRLVCVKYLNPEDQVGQCNWHATGAEGRRPLYGTRMDNSRSSDWAVQLARKRVDNEKVNASEDEWKDGSRQ